jgi:hypothetical protein
MTTSLNQGTPARDSGYQTVSFLRKPITNASPATGVLGSIPAGAAVVGGGVFVSTAFSATATVDVGYAADSLGAAAPTAYASAIDVTALGYLPLDELANAGGSSKPRTVDTQLTYRINNAPAAGAADIIVLFVPNRP